MKIGTRKFNNDSKITSIEGNPHKFNKGDKVIVEVINRQEGICRFAEGAEIYKCKAVKGRTTII